MVYFITCHIVVVMPGHAAIRFVPFALFRLRMRWSRVDTSPWTCLCAAAHSWAMQLLSVALHKGNAEAYRRPGLLLSREQGIRYDVGCLDI